MIIVCVCVYVHTLVLMYAYMYTYAKHVYGDRARDYQRFALCAAQGAKLGPLDFKSPHGYLLGPSLEKPSGGRPWEHNHNQTTTTVVVLSPAVVVLSPAVVA